MSTTPPAPPPKTWWERYHPLVVWVVVTLTTAAVSGFLGVRLAPLPPPVVVEREVPAPAPFADGNQSPMFAPPGWAADPDEVWAVQKALAIGTFAESPAGKVSADELPKWVYGWKPYVHLFGRPPPVKNQGQVGSCVSFGTNTAVERTLAGEIVRRKGGPEEWSRFAEEVTYAGSRVEVGGGRIRGDGSVGAWAAQFVTRWGVVPRKNYPGTDLTTYDEARARAWGQSGVPDELEKLAKQFPVKSTTRVESWDEFKKAAAQGYFVAVCSNQGFAAQRDGNGVARPQGSWAHCMALDGYHTDESGREYGHVTNSWGENFHRGPVGWGDPNPDGFWAEAAVVDRMLRQGDSWAFSGVTGFPRREPLDWAARPARPRGALVLDTTRGGRCEVSWSW